MQTVIVGSRFHRGAVNAIMELELRRHPDNKYDPEAVAVYVDAQMLGYIPLGSSGIARALDRGERLVAQVVDARLPTPKISISTEAEF